MSHLIDIVDVAKHYVVRRGVMSHRRSVVKAVDGVSFSIAEGESVGLVGESGCGKSTLARIIVRLLEPTMGYVMYRDSRVADLRGRAYKEFRRSVQMVFQDPFSSLNPRRCVEDIIEYPLRVHEIGTKAERRRQVLDMMEKVGLDPRIGDRYPHQFSGGQRQRIAVARALILKPKLVVLDEPVSSLDVSIQAQILNLLMDLKREYSLTYLFISHDLRVVHYVCDRVVVMYLGRIVEIARPDQLLSEGRHPYTQVLFSSAYIKEHDQAWLETDAEVPSAAHPPSGCRFRMRCCYAKDRCAEEDPVLRQVENERWVACHYA